MAVDLYKSTPHMALCTVHDALCPVDGPKMASLAALAARDIVIFGRLRAAPLLDSGFTGRTGFALLKE